MITKECSIRVRAILEFQHISWTIIRPNKPNLVKNKLQKVDLGEVYTQKVGETLENILILLYYRKTLLL